MNTKPQQLFAPSFDALIQCAQHNLKHEGHPLTTITDKLVREIKKLLENPDEYNAYVELNLAFNKRFGRILRSDYWLINQDEKEYFVSDFTAEDIKRFKTIAESSDLKTHRNTIFLST